MIKHLFSVILLIFLSKACAQKIAPFGPLPSERQLAWHDLDFYLFAHFGPNTFTGVEWGDGQEPVELFDPKRLDCRQWARIAKSAGAKGIIVTAKHHDGFCLWPSEQSDRTVRQSHWRDGKGDVLAELRRACDEMGIGMGAYLSPWDRGHPKYGSAEYNGTYASQMSEVVSNYGPLFEFWWDGANGEGPNGRRQTYDFRFFEAMMREIAPETPIFSDIGPDIRWVGNERGDGSTTNWCFLDTLGFERGEGAPPNDTLARGNLNGSIWLPSEVDVSIRPGWFWKPEEDSKVKTPEQLFGIWLRSVGRGSNLLLNVPPNADGLISKPDSAALAGFRRLLDENFSKSLIRSAVIFKADGDRFVGSKNLTDQRRATFEPLPIRSTGLKTIWRKPQKINCLQLREPLQLGQRVATFRVRFKKDGETVGQIDGTTIGNRRILTFPALEADSFEIEILSARARPLLSEIDAFLIDEKLIER